MEKLIKQHLKAKLHDKVMKDERLFFFGEYETPVKDGRFSLPKQYRQFNDGEAIVFRKSKNFPFLSLFPRTFEKSLVRHKPKIMLHVSIGSGGMVNLGRDVCRKVFNKLDFDAVILGAVNGIQVWDKKEYSSWSRLT